MPEPLTTSLVTEVLEELHVAFPGRRTDAEVAKLASVYRNGLTGISGDGLRHAAKRAVQEDQYFPKVARLRELAAGYEAHNRAEAWSLAQPDPLWCPRCQSRAKVRDRWRPAVKPGDYRAWLVSADGNWLLLDPYPRELCNCAAACHYEPEIGVEPPAMRLTFKPTMPLRRTDIVIHTELAVSA